jgi:hypothetical protein
LDKGVALPLSGVTADVLLVQQFRDVRHLCVEECANTKFVVVCDGQRGVVPADFPVEVGVPGSNMVWGADDVADGGAVDFGCAHHPPVVKFVLVAVAECPAVGVAAPFTLRVDFAPVRVAEVDTGFGEGLLDFCEGVGGEFVVCVHLYEDVAFGEHEAVVFGEADVAAGWNMWFEQFDVVALVGAERVHDVVGVALSAVVVDSPCPVAVGLGFQRRPGSGELLGCVVVQRGTNVDVGHVLPLVVAARATVRTVRITARPPPMFVCPRPTGTSGRLLGRAPVVATGRCPRRGAMTGTAAVG